MTTIAVEIAERKRVGRLIAAGSLAFTLLIGLVAGVLAVAA